MKNFIKQSISFFMVRHIMSNKKEVILQTAINVFAKYGFDRATTKLIAKEAGISEGTIYNHFENKADLLVQIFKRLWDDTVPEIKKEIALLKNPDEQMQVLVKHIINVFKDNNALLKVFLVKVLSIEDSLKDSIMNVRVDIITIIADILNYGIKETIYRKDLNIDIVPLIIYGSIEGLLTYFAIIEDSFKAYSDVANKELMNAYFRIVR